MISTKDVRIVAFCKNYEWCDEYCISEGKICENFALKLVSDEMLELKKGDRCDLIQRAFRRISSSI